jgi:anti-sigma-K factor RskA
MSALRCAEVQELAPELALGVLGGAERAEAVLHVNGCVRCQALVAEFAEVADMLPTLAPELEPPAGFEARTRERLGAPRRRSRRRLLIAAAVAAAAAAIISITVVRVVESTTDGGGSAPVAVAMVDSSGSLPAGWAYLTDARSLAVSVDYGVTDGKYTVRVDPTVGAATELGSMTVTGGRGSFTGHSPVPLAPGSTIALVNAAGVQTCHGTVS